MRIQEATIPIQFAKLIFDLVGISDNFSKISNEIESKIKEDNGEGYSSDDNANQKKGLSYHEIALLSEYKSQDCINGLLSNAQVEKLCKVSDEGNLRVDVARLGSGRSQHEWSIKLNIPKSPHMKDGEKFVLHVELSYRLEDKLGPKITSAWQKLDDEDLSKIFIAYSLVYM